MLYFDDRTQYFGIKAVDDNGKKISKEQNKKLTKAGHR